MSGSGYEKRRQALAMQVATLRRQGLTNRRIAEITGVDVDKVPARVQLGERLLNQAEGK